MMLVEVLKVSQERMNGGLQKKNPSVCSFILKILALRGTRASQRVIHLTNKIELGILANEGALYSEIERKKGEQRVKPKSL